MPRLVVCSHNLKSNALKNLAAELSTQLGYKVWRTTTPKAHQHPVSFLPGIDKRNQFASFHREGVPAPLFATDLESASKLETKAVVVRMLTDSSEGRGISIVPTGELTQVAPLYTEYIPKKKEYRVHVWPDAQGQPAVVDTQEKRKKRNHETERDTQVRNTANGYVFCRDGVTPPVDCHDVALKSVLALGRTYGAVDVIYNEKRNKCYVLEVNSRPGMEGTTVKKYAEAIMGSLPDNVLHPINSRVNREPVAMVRADGKKLIRTKKGAKVWR